MATPCVVLDMVISDCVLEAVRRGRRVSSTGRRGQRGTPTLPGWKCCQSPHAHAGHVQPLALAWGTWDPQGQGSE